MIDKQDVIASEENNLVQEQARKKLLEWYPKDGIVRLEKDKKVYELTKKQAEDYAYQQLNDPLSTKKLAYTKMVDDITTKYTITMKDSIKLDDYKDTPLYDTLSKNPAYLNKLDIEALIKEGKTKALAAIQSQKISDEDDKILQSKVDEFVKDIKNFDKYKVTKDNAKEVTSNGVVSVVGDNKTESNKSVQLTEPQKTVIETIVKENNTQKVERKDGLKVLDNNPKWENNTRFPKISIMIHPHKLFDSRIVSFPSIKI